ncbi:MAG: hypothetical protein IJB36_05895 [Clostridia bacterium]|nr:hypothetical protein [Clostridia bacterium]
MKRIWFKLTVIFVVVSVLLTASGCQKKKSITKNQVASSQIAADLKQHPSVVKCFYSSYVKTNEFTFDKYEIIKRKIDTEDGKDTINCYIYANNEYFSVKAQATLHYIHYDVGDWVLDNLTIHDKEVAPLRGPDLDLVVEGIKKAYEAYGNEYDADDQWLYQHLDNWLAFFANVEGFSHYLQNFKFEDLEVSSDFRSASLNVSFKSSLTEVKGLFSLKFQDVSGWRLVEYPEYDRPNFNINDYTADYSESLGNFMEHYISKRKLNIFEINGNVIKVQITEYYIDHSKTYMAEGTFDILSGEFYITWFDFYYYNPTSKEWEYTNNSTKTTISCYRVT